MELYIKFLYYKYTYISERKNKLTCMRDTLILVGNHKEEVVDSHSFQNKALVISKILPQENKIFNHLIHTKGMFGKNNW